MSRQHLDFKVPGTDKDSGEADNTAIKPVADGEPGQAAVFKRPSENLRTRTEFLRTAADDMKYLSDYDRALLLTSTGSITWAGLPTGTFTTSANLTLKPFLAPDASTAARLIIAAGTVGQITFRTKQNGVAGQPRAYNGANTITFDFTPVTTGTGAIVVTADGTPANNVHIQYDDHPVSGTTVDQIPANSMVQQFNASAVAISLGLEAVVEGTGSPVEVGFPTPPASIAATKIADAVNGIQPAEMLTRYMSGAADAEKHNISPAQLTNFFADPLNTLLEGDVIAIRYDELVMVGDGGRRQSIDEFPEDKADDAGLNLFLVRRFPARLPLALPLAAVVNGQLIFISGRVFGPGESGPLVSSGSSYQGSSPNQWADTTTLPAASFETTIDTIVSLLGTKTGGTPGAIKVGFTPTGNIAANTVKGALEELDSEKFGLSLNNTSVGTNNFTRGGNAGTTMFVTGGTSSGAAINATGGNPNGTAITATGAGNGAAVVGTGAGPGAASHGLIGYTRDAGLFSDPNGPYGVVGVAGDTGAAGHGVVGVGASESGGSGVVGVGSIATAVPFPSDSSGVLGLGADGSLGPGVHGQGGSANGPGVKGVGGGTNGHGLEAEGKGTGAGVFGQNTTGTGRGGSFTGGPTGPSSYATRMNGAGVEAIGGTAGNANGVVGRGGSAATQGVRTEAFANNGIVGVGTGGGSGVVGVSAATTATAGVDGYGSTGVDGIGVRGTGSGNAAGVHGIPGGTGPGLRATAGSSGIGVEANGRVASVTDPTSAQDAATKNYVDALGSPQNFVINGDVTFWQRGTAALTLTTTRQFLADRFYAFIAAGSGANTTYNQLNLFGLGAFYAGISRTAGVDTNLAARSLVHEVEYDGDSIGTNVTRIAFSNATQPLRIQFAHAIGSGLSGTLVFKLVTGTGGRYDTGFAGAAVAYTSPNLAGLPLGTYVVNLPINTVPTTAKRLALVWEWTPTASPAVANETFHIRGVMLMIGNPGLITLPNYAGKTLAGELEACQRFYEKSGPIAGTPGVGGASTYTGSLISLLTPNGQVWPIGSPPRFKTRKRVPPVVTIWDSGGNLNSWSLDAPRATAAVLVSDTEFHLANNTGGNVTPTTGLSSGQWAADAEI